MCLPVDEQCVVTRQEEVVNKPFGLLEFVFGAVYVNLHKECVFQWMNNVW